MYNPTQRIENLADKEAPKRWVWKENIPFAKVFAVNFM